MSALRKRIGIVRKRLETSLGTYLGLLILCPLVFPELVSGGYPWRKSLLLMALMPVGILLLSTTLSALVRAGNSWGSKRRDTFGRRLPKAMPKSGPVT